MRLEQWVFFSFHFIFCLLNNYLQLDYITETSTTPSHLLLGQLPHPVSCLLDKSPMLLCVGSQLEDQKVLGEMSESADSLAGVLGQIGKEHSP